MSVRVRFAPSPTGYLHIGGLRTALYAYLFARHHGGKLILRIEDTDQARFVADAEDDILSSLRWCGLKIDEGPDHGGVFGPYRQSERQPIYVHHARSLVAAGHAYYAFDTPEALIDLRKNNTAYGIETRDKMDNSFTQSQESVTRRLEAQEDYVIRLRVPENQTIGFNDLIKGPIEVKSQSIDDQVLIKSDGMPTYHLANVVDDHLMEITHVIRGDEWIPSTPKHILLYKAFGFPPPLMAHLPLILSPTGGKLSKRSAERQGIPLNVRDYFDQGFEPEALVNFLAMLGWNPGTEEEVFDRTELELKFTLNRVGSAPAQFDLTKLKWFNAQHLRRLDVDILITRVRPLLEKSGITISDDHYLRNVCDLIIDRLEMTRDLTTMYRYFFEDPNIYDPVGVKKRWKPDSALLVQNYADQMEALKSFDASALEVKLRDLAQTHEIGAGRIIHPVRLAISGTTTGPSLFPLLQVLGQSTCVRRLRTAVHQLAP